MKKKSVIMPNAFTGMKTIEKIVFLDNHNNIPQSNLEDFSKNRDMSVVGWYEGSTLFVAPMYGNKIFACTDCSFMFKSCFNLKEIIGLESFDTSDVRNMSFMFVDCVNLKSIDLSSFDTSNVIRTIGMFSRCKSLTTLNLSNFNTQNVRFTNWMMAKCKSIKDIDMSSFDLSKVKSLYGMFYGCESLRRLKFPISSVPKC